MLSSPQADRPPPRKSPAPALNPRSLCRPPLLYRHGTAARARCLQNRHNAADSRPRPRRTPPLGGRSCCTTAHQSQTLPSPSPRSRTLPSTGHASIYPLLPCSRQLACSSSTEKEVGVSLTTRWPAALLVLRGDGGGRERRREHDSRRGRDLPSPPPWPARPQEQEAAQVPVHCRGSRRPQSSSAAAALEAAAATSAGEGSNGRPRRAGQGTGHSPASGEASSSSECHGAGHSIRPNPHPHPTCSGLLCWPGKECLCRHANPRSRAIAIGSSPASAPGLEFEGRRMLVAASSSRGWTMRWLG